ncbi:CDK5 regulatory subunit-associated protein 2-like isoform X2 [Centruroides vittatus]|uniref:CDK5 regulatory subunit-associated protein 2-like isoform X2 n=1 Tax=Centruroides vittatus TaxID=120091 RepID=UPI00350EB66F
MDLTEIEDRTLPPINMEFSANNSQVSMEVTSDSVDGLSGVGCKTGYISPLRARTMKEYEQQISDLQKENFNLKLRLYFLEEKMEKNFDCDTRQLHEINIQLKIEAETMRKDLEQKEKLLQETRINLQKVEETYQKEINEWIENFKKESNFVKDKVEKEDELVQESITESEGSMTELYKQAFGSDVCSQAQTDISESSQNSDKENMLEESISTLQKLDQLHKEELSDLRATTRANQSNLENYVAKLKKQHITQKQSDSKDSSTNTSENEGKKDLSDTFSISSEKSISPAEMCPNCKVIADKTLEKKVDLMKKQSLKRDKTIQGLTEILYRKEKDLKYFRNKLGEKEALDQLLKLVKQSINSAITTTEIDQTVITNLSIALRKYLSTYQSKEEMESLENSIESFEKHYLQWLTIMQNKSVHNEESSLEESNDDIKKELASLHQAVKDKNLFIQELLTERKNAVTENSKSVENLLNNLKQKDIYIQDLQSKLEELEKCLKKEENINEKDLIRSKVDITELINKKEELASDNEKLKLEHSKIKEKLDAVLKQKDNEIERLNELYEKLQHKTEELEFEIDEKMGELHECEKERDSLKEQFSLQKEKTIDIVNYEKEIELMKEQLENTKLTNNTLQNAITEKDHLLEVINKRHIELQNEYIKSQHSLTEKINYSVNLKQN